MMIKQLTVAGSLLEKAAPACGEFASPHMPASAAAHFSGERKKDDIFGLGFKRGHTTSTELPWRLAPINPGQASSRVLYVDLPCPWCFAAQGKSLFAALSAGLERGQRAACKEKKDAIRMLTVTLSHHQTLEIRIMDSLQLLGGMARDSVYSAKKQVRKAYMEYVQWRCGGKVLRGTRWCMHHACISEA